MSYVNWDEVMTEPTTCKRCGTQYDLAEHAVCPACDAKIPAAGCGMDDF